MRAPPRIRPGSSDPTPGPAAAQGPAPPSMRLDARVVVRAVRSRAAAFACQEHTRRPDSEGRYARQACVLPLGAGSRDRCRSTRRARAASESCAWWRRRRRVCGHAAGVIAPRLPADRVCAHDWVRERRVGARTVAASRWFAGRGRPSWPAFCGRMPTIGARESLRPSWSPGTRFGRTIREWAIAGGEGARDRTAVLRDHRLLAEEQAGGRGIRSFLVRLARRPAVRLRDDRRAADDPRRSRTGRSVA